MFVEIDTVLSPRGLKNPQLDILRPDVYPYDTAILQPTGRITGGDTYVRNIDPVEAKAKHLEFFNIALSKACSLAVTPEYSCPWDCIREMLSTSKFPGSGHIWAIGAESIQPEELEQFKTQFQGSYEIIHEAYEVKTFKFFDPVCFFFNTEDQEGNLKKVILIQFKTKSLGDAPHHFERDRLILGKSIYKFRSRETHSINFVTLICSDVLGITNDQFDPVITRSLILHIQLNSNPRSPTYAQYRRFCFDAISDDSEIICVNWAEKVYCPETDPQGWDNISGSGIYLKSKKSDLSDLRVNQNHSLGLYLTFWESFKTYVHYFNYAEHIFLYRNTKPWQQIGTNQQAGRTGPEMIETLNWVPATSKWALSVLVNDGFANACRRITGNLTSLLNLQNRPIDIERLLTLSHGFASIQSWSKVENQTFFHIDASEILNRISFAQDNHASAIRSRDHFLSKFAVLAEILTDANNYPITIKDLFGNSTLDASVSEPIRNLVSSSKSPATVVYIGENPVVGEVEKIYANLQMLLANDKKDTFRLTIWYKDLSGRTKFFPPELLPDADLYPDDQSQSALITRD